MKKFEYLIRHYLSKEKLNELGQEGWELVCVDNDEFILKREII